MIEKQKKWIPDVRIGFSEKNLNRWAIFGGRNPRIETILKRENDRGEVVETCQIGAVGYKNRMWSLNAIHGRMVNVIELIFRRHGWPDNNTIKVSSLAFYNYISDVATLFDEKKMRDRDGSRYRDWVYDSLHVLTQVALMFSCWEKKDGSKAAYRMNILKGFKIWGKDKDAEWGTITIVLDPEFADGLRAKNTTPLLIEVENSIKGDNAFALYRYLRQVLFKTPIFRCEVGEISRRLSIGRKRKDHLLEDLRSASKAIIGLEIPNGRIESCEILNEGREWLLVAKYGKVERRILHLSQMQERRRAEEQRARDAEMKEKDVLQKFENLPLYDKEKIEKRIEEIMAAKGASVKYGPAIHRQAAIIDAMENYFRQKSDEVFGRHCLRENNPPPYMRKEKRIAIRKLAATLRQYAATIPATNPQ